MGITRTCLECRSITGRNPFHLSLLVLLIAGIPACESKTDSQTRVIEGIICTTANLDHAHIITSINKNPRYTPIEGAKVYLALDKEGTHPIEGSETSSGADGSYRIDTTEMELPTGVRKNFFIVVKKNGYEPYAHIMTVGPFSMYRRNTIVLKPLPGTGQRKEGNE